MTVKSLWNKLKKLFGSTQEHLEYAAVDEDGLIDDGHESPGVTVGAQPEQSNKMAIRKVQNGDKTQSLEKLHGAFNQLVEKLQGINESLNRQVIQQMQLTKRMDELPQLLTTLPAMVQGQKQVVDQLAEQVKGFAFKSQQFIDVVERIPQETVKQTEALCSMTHQLSAVAESDVAMRECFSQFNETLAKLNRATTAQTESIVQMSKTFAAGDRYMKYLVLKQSRRFMWVFLTALGVCVFAICALAVVAVILVRR
jgi:predicted RND superfamily exporter protein